MDIERKWIGKYWFCGNIPEIFKTRKTEFELTIDYYKNSKIAGEIFDNNETGGTAGIGNFTGTIKGNIIKFVKKMPISTSILPDGTVIEEEKKHRPIYYKGVIDSISGEITGTWKFKIGFGIAHGRIVYYPKTHGKWEMKSKNTLRSKLL